MINYYKKRKCNNILEHKGRPLSDKEAKRFLNWAHEKGYKSTSDIPDHLADKQEWNIIINENIKDKQSKQQEIF